MNRLEPLRPDAEEDGGDEWLASFSDMITLMLCFFVVLTAIFAIREQEIFEAAIGSLKGLGRTGTENPELVERQGVMRGVTRRLETLAEGPPYTGSVKVERQMDGIEIEMNEKMGNVLFPSGSANLTRDAQQMIFEIFKQILSPASNSPSAPEAYRQTLLRSISYIEIQGHTDSLPPSSHSRYPSNWEISLARANNVRRFLEHIGLTEGFLHKVRVAGYADNRPAVSPEVVPGDPEQTEANRAKNRRVVFFLSTTKG